MVRFIFLDFALADELERLLWEMKEAWPGP